MKTIGMIGSVSWQATVEYYRIINEVVADKLGGHHSAKIVMACTDFEDLVRLAKENNWNGIADILTKEVKKLEDGGADFFLICANTLHKVADKITSRISIPILHIVEVTAQKIKEQKIKRATLLGTNFTMEDGFYQEIMEKHNIEIMTPDNGDRLMIHKSIFEELTFGKLLESTRQEYRRIIQSQIEQGSQGLILGCTEIPLLIGSERFSIPTFDTTQIHAKASAERALEG